jgi:hypothetical protein
MRIIKLFKEMSSTARDYPKYGNGLSQRELKILLEVSDLSFILRFNIKTDDGYYYTSLQNNHNYLEKLYNRFDSFNDLKDYIFLRYNYSDEKILIGFEERYDDDDVVDLTRGQIPIDISEIKDIVETIKRTKLGLSIDNNWLMNSACKYGHIEIVDFLFKNKNINPTYDDNRPIKIATKNRYTELASLLLQDHRVVEHICKSIRSRRSYPEFEENLDYIAFLNSLPILKMLMDIPEIRACISEEDIKKYERHLKHYKIF